MRIEVAWNKPDGTQSAIGFGTNLDDPYRDDEEMQIAKALGGAQAHFHQKFGEAPPVNQLQVRVIKE